MILVVRKACGVFLIGSYLPNNHKDTPLAAIHLTKQTPLITTPTRTILTIRKTTILPLLIASVIVRLLFIIYAILLIEFEEAHCL